MSIVRFTNQYPSVFNRFFENDMLDGWNRNFSTNQSTTPSVNIKESAEDFEVEVAAPGFGKDDFKIELNHDQLVISSSKETENDSKEGKEYTRREFSYQSFSRSFTLPNTVDSEKIEAHYENGILKLSIPKKEEVKPKPARLISIR